MVQARWLDEHEQRTWRAYLTATQLLADQLERELQRDAGIPHGYYEILVRLSEARDRRLRMSELATASLSSRSRLSHAVARMEAAGWIRRETCATDRRGLEAVLTDDGFEVLHRAAPGHVEGVRAHLFDQLDESDVAALRTISEKVAAHLTELAPGRGWAVKGDPQAVGPDDLCDVEPFVAKAEG